MITINSIKAFIKDVDKRDFGFTFEFNSGLNILTGDNSSGKSTVLSCIYYSLGMEQLAAYGSSDGLKECLKVSFKYDNRNHLIFSSYVELRLTNFEGSEAFIRRSVKSEYDENVNLISVQVNDSEAEDKFIHATGDTDHEGGFYRWLSEFSGIKIPMFTDEDGTKIKILYLQQIFAGSFVEQTKGWSDFFAQIPVFNTKKAKQKIVEYTLGLSGLTEEFELDKLKEQEKELKQIWANNIETFQALASNYNLYTANLTDTFTTELTPKKIQQLKLQTKVEEDFVDLDEIIRGLIAQFRDSRITNLISTTPSLLSTELVTKHKALTEKLKYLNNEYKKIQDERINEKIKVQKYLKTIDQLTKEIEGLEGINKLNKLQFINIGDVEHCPVCNSSLLTTPNISLKNLDKIGPVKSLAFYKSEKNLYESYIKNSNKLISRFEKINAYYESRIAEVKDLLSTIDAQLLDDARIPSRVAITEELRLKFELEKMQKISDYFGRFKNDLQELAEKLADIRSRKALLASNKQMDEDKILTFKQRFTGYLATFGYSTEILNRVYIAPEEPNKLFPVVSVMNLPPQPIRFVSSASDFIRAQWAFYLSLLVMAKYHLGILVLDEPGQHAMRSADMAALLSATSKVKDRQTILAISIEERVKSTNLNEEGATESKLNLQTILKESGLVLNVDYTLNTIEGNGRIDKCIQPLGSK